ncbi:MAG: YdeI/OmpD-associated family protein, partial [Dehalococcoidia bacterium]|nr:YdeI/OmpD-associated family protein [Dehalococcoidia bacterium]
SRFLSFYVIYLPGKNILGGTRQMAELERLETSKVRLTFTIGNEKIEEAKNSGHWSASKPLAITDEQVEVLLGLLRAYEPACSNFLAMSASVKRTYTRAYFDAKTDDGRTKRLAWMVKRLNKNLKPM